ncbi:unnamed protein product [Gordionus sp. m RMFG-2023]
MLKNSESPGQPPIRVAKNDLMSPIPGTKSNTGTARLDHRGFPNEYESFGFSLFDSSAFLAPPPALLYEGTDVMADAATVAYKNCYPRGVLSFTSSHLATSETDDAACSSTTGDSADTRRRFYHLPIRGPDKSLSLAASERRKDRTGKANNISDLTPDSTGIGAVGDLNSDSPAGLRHANRDDGRLAHHFLSSFMSTSNAARYPLMAYTSPLEFNNVESSPASASALPLLNNDNRGMVLSPLTSTAALINYHHFQKNQSRSFVLHHHFGDQRDQAHNKKNSPLDARWDVIVKSESEEQEFSEDRLPCFLKSSKKLSNQNVYTNYSSIKKEETTSNGIHITGNKIEHNVQNKKRSRLHEPDHFEPLGGDGDLDLDSEHLNFSRHVSHQRDNDIRSVGASIGNNLDPNNSFPFFMKNSSFFPCSAQNSFSNDVNDKYNGVDSRNQETLSKRTGETTSNGSNPSWSIRVPRSSPVTSYDAYDYSPLSHLSGTNVNLPTDHVTLTADTEEIPASSFKHGISRGPSSISKKPTTQNVCGNHPRHKLAPTPSSGSGLGSTTCLTLHDDYNAISPVSPYSSHASIAPSILADNEAPPLKTPHPANPTPSPPYPPFHPLSNSKHLCAICGDKASGKHYGVYRYISCFR